MCGIIGYTGSGNAMQILLEGLKRLEYRGYDSAGVAVRTDSGIAVRRVLGKIANLTEKLSREPLSGKAGIGHTRWATHGRPSEENAHPHEYGGVVVVHNGIIENYMELREKITAAGHAFRSETDTEVFSHLISMRLEAGARPLSEAVRSALGEVRGAYAIAVMWREAPDEIVVAKNASPLVVGLGDGENYVASDIPAILPYTNRMLFLQEGDICSLAPGSLTLTNLHGEEVRREPRRIEWSAVAAEKGGYKHFMHKEIHEQPRAVTDTMRGRIMPVAGDVHFDGFDFEGIARAGVERISIVACGTSYHAGMAGRYMIERLARVPVEVDLASEFRYRDPLLSPGVLVVAISQSGETADTLAAMREAKAKGCRALAICNVMESSIAREADGTIYTHAGPEIGVASTKAFTTQLVALYLLGIKLGRILGRLPEAEIRQMLRRLAEIPYIMEEVLRAEGEVRLVARKYMACRNFLYLARGIQYPIALEGALKLKELSYIHAEGYAAGEMKHGPIALIDEEMPVVVIAPADSTYQKLLANVQEVHSRDGRIIALCHPDDKAVSALATDVIRLPEVDPLLAPLVSVIPLQVLAYHIADLRGTDVDQPRNLAKSVTVE